MVARDYPTEQVGIPLDEFIRDYDLEGPFELINGERISLMPNVVGHGAIVKLLYDLLVLLEQTAGIVVQRELPYVLTYSPDWVRGSRVPDLMIFLAERLVAYEASVPNWRDKPYLLVPDVCVEVVSPNDIYGEVDEKVERYLQDGVRLIWVINPRTRTIHVYHGTSGQVQRLTEQDTLDGGGIIPNFSISVGALFKA
jgi:Uma2 family endonuclease